jgi:hypothetical protein
MTLGLPYWQLALAVGAAVLVFGLGVWLYFRHESSKLDEEVEQAVTNPNTPAELTMGDERRDETGDEPEAKPGHEATIDPPDVKNSIFGLIKQWRHRAKAQKMAAKGYVRWMKVNDSACEMKWVKPVYRGMGVAEYYDSGDDATYLFPRRAMAIDDETGAWFAVHPANDADPINLADPVAPSIPADQLQTVIDSAQQMEKPSLLDRIDITGTQAFIIVTVVLFLVYAATTVMGGGL